MAKYDYDLLVIGAGSGGVAAARRAGAAGARVAICESDRVGGTCVLRGCIPKKLLIYGSHFAEEFKDARAFGWSVDEPALDWARLIKAKDKELDRLNGIYIRMLRDAGVELIEGRGKLLDAHSVDVGGHTHTAETILIGTGGWPVMPDIPGIEHAITSNEALELTRLPRRMVIVGSGFIAVEFAGIFNAAGVEVTEILRADTVLRGFDEDVRLALARAMEKKGIELRTGTVVRSIEKRNSGYSLLLHDGETMETDVVFYATGRAPNTGGIGLAEAGVALDKKGAVVVDEWSRSTVPNIYAVGDCTNRMNLTPVAIAEARALVETLYRGNPTRMDYGNIPAAVFSQPPVATVGMTEAQARGAGHEVDIYLSCFRPLKHSISGRDEQAMTKLVVERGSDKVLGCHIVGADGPEIIQGLAVALRAGATKAIFDATIAVHPTTAEEFVLMREPASLIGKGDS
jgi:glutathione reductase (NADPH)